MITLPPKTTKPLSNSTTARAWFLLTELLLFLRPRYHTVIQKLGRINTTPRAAFSLSLARAFFPKKAIDCSIAYVLHRLLSTRRLTDYSCISSLACQRYAFLSHNVFCTASNHGQWHHCSLGTCPNSCLKNSKPIRNRVQKDMESRLQTLAIFRYDRRSCSVFPSRTECRRPRYAACRSWLIQSFLVKKTLSPDRSGSKSPAYASDQGCITQGTSQSKLLRN